MEQKPVEKPKLSPISGSIEFEYMIDSESLVPNKLSMSLPNEMFEDLEQSKPISATNELPLTELNLALFTSKLDSKNSCVMSTNELPLSSLKFTSRSCRVSRQNTFDSQTDDISLEVNWDSDLKELDDKPKASNESGRHRSFSDPNILDVEWISHSDKNYLMKKYSDSMKDQTTSLSPPETGPFSPFSFYPEHAPDSTCLLCATPRTNPHLLSFFTSPPRRLSTSRSLSHPTPCVNPCISNADCGGQSIKRHRHGIAGQMSYYKMLGFGCGGPIGLKKLVGGSANSLFSTAVISGSSSAPNLRDMITSTTNATAIEGFGGVPAIRPLETLHNALSLKQLDTFLDRMTTAPIFRTPSSTPPRYPSTPLPTPTNGCGLSMDKGRPLKLQSPSNSVGWSGPPSLMSSSGPSSPGYSESNSKGSSSEMSSSIISADGITVDNINKIFPTAPGLDQDLGSVGMLLDSFDKDISESLEFSDYYSGNKPRGSESGEITPVSGSEADFNTNDATMGSNAECDITVTEDIEENSAEDNNLDPNNETITSATVNSLSHIFNTHRSVESNNLFQQNAGSPKLSPLSSHANFCANVLSSDSSLKHVENIERVQPSTSRAVNEFDSSDLKTIIKKSNIFDKEIPNVSKNLSNVINDKWSTSKEKFLETKSFIKTDNIDFGKNLNVNVEKKVEKDNELAKINPETVLVKEKYIEPTHLSRVAKSFHGKPHASTSNIDTSNISRRSSDSPLAKSSNLSFTTESPSANIEKATNLDVSRPSGSGIIRHPDANSSMVKGQRFTTTRVDEAEHAASLAKGFPRRFSTATDGMSSTSKVPPVSSEPSRSNASVSLTGHKKPSLKEHEKITKSVSDNSNVFRRRDSDKS